MGKRSRTPMVWLSPGLELTGFINSTRPTLSTLSFHAWLPTVDEFDQKRPIQSTSKTYT